MVRDCKRLIFLIFMMLFTIAVFSFFACSDVFGASKYAKGKIISKGGTVVRKAAANKGLKKSALRNGRNIYISSMKFNSKTSTKSKYIWYYSPTFKGYVRADKVKVTKYKKYYGHTTSEVNMRAGAGTSFKVKKVVPDNKTVTVIIRCYDKKNKKWFKVQYGKTKGYISADYLSGGKAKTVSAAAMARVSTDFPDSYRQALEKLASKHPNWVFKPVNTGLDWKKAVSKMTKNRGTNTIAITYAPSYRAVTKGCYDYLNDEYVGRDGAYFVSASPAAVRYYMDPRNWLTEDHIFMFEDQTYHPTYQTIDMVRAVFKESGYYRNKTLYKNAESFIKAGETYDVNPLYLASKAYLEQGSSVYYSKIGGNNIYNVFNIGANDSSSGGVTNGMRFASTGSSYGRPWTSVSKSIMGGTKYIKDNFIANNQSSSYLEHFNVLNGLESVGTHVYMTAVFAPMSTAYSKAGEYRDYGIMNHKLEFYIPVFSNMPAEPCEKPSTSFSKDNNNFLASLVVTVDGSSRTLISASSLNYTQTFSVNAGKGTSIAIKASKASKTAAKVSGTGTFKLSNGTNNFKVKCTSSSGITRVYTINVTK